MPGVLKQIKDGFISWFVKQRPIMKVGMKFVELNYYAGRVPVLKSLHPWVKTSRNSASYLPFRVTVNQELGRPVNEVLPPQILHDLIDQAEQHILMDECLCRRTQECENHDPGIGCLFMGPSALAHIPEKIGRRASRQEAHAHVERAVKNGLVPMAGKVRVDNFLFLAPERHQLLSVCFCCHCCCMMGYYRHAGRQMDHMMEPIPGARVTVTDACQGCGTCIETCIFEAIRLENGRAVHTDACRVCGRCERYCPNQAVELVLENPDYLEDVKTRILSYVRLK